MNFFFTDSKENIHHESLPYSIRMLIVGESGSGKTTLLMRLLLEDGLLNYENLYVFSSLHQPEYQCLIHGLNNGLSKATIASMLNSGKEIGKNSIEEIAKTYAKIYGSTSDINNVY